MVSTKISLLLTVLFWCVKCQNSTVKQHVNVYEQNVKTSIDLERQDRILVNSWTEQLQIKQVNVTSSFRMQMMKHKEHSFGIQNKNEEWNNCKSIYNDDIKKTENTYYAEEMICLRLANAADRDKKHAVEQIEKEIHKWRKSYRYLKKLCNSSETVHKEEVESCLVEYMLRDNYSQTLQRLLQIKREAVIELQHVMVKAVVDLEECLDMLLSKYLDMVRSVMDLLKICYEVKVGIIK